MVVTMSFGIRMGIPLMTDRASDVPPDTPEGDEAVQPSHGAETPHDFRGSLCHLPQGRSGGVESDNVVKGGTGRPRDLLPADCRYEGNGAYDADIDDARIVPSSFNELFEILDLVALRIESAENDHQPPLPHGSTSPHTSLPFQKGSRFPQSVEVKRYSVLLAGKLSRESYGDDSADQDMPGPKTIAKSYQVKPTTDEQSGNGGNTPAFLSTLACQIEHTL